MTTPAHKRTLTVAAAAGIGLALTGSLCSVAAEELPAPAHRRVVLHGVALDRQRGTVQSDSARLLDEAIAASSLRRRVEIVALTQPAEPAADHESPARLCGATIVRSYLTDKGLPLARTMSVTVPPPQPSSLLALATDGSAHCRVGFVVD